MPLPEDVAPLPPVDPLALTPEMRRWVRERLPPALPERERLERLVRALGEDELGLSYDPWFIGTAAEVFASRRYNCLSFSHLLVALSREVGLDTYYLEAAGVERYAREGDLVLLSGHVTVAWGLGAERWVVELGVGPRFDYQRGRAIADERALALHYANLGATSLRAGALEQAVAALLAAVRADPSSATAWVNLGVALRRRGNAAGAEAAYRRAIAADPRGYSGYGNLYALLRSLGRRDDAAALVEHVSRRGNRNPWLLLALGDACLQARDPVAARRLYRRARAVAPGEAAPAAALAGWWLAAGDPGRAGRWARRAAELDPAEPRLVALEPRLPPVR